MVVEVFGRRDAALGGVGRAGYSGRMAIRPELRDELLKLPADERLALAEELYSSVPERMPDAEWDQAWADEIRARIEDIRAGRAEGRPASEVFADVRARLASRG